MGLPGPPGEKGSTVRNNEEDPNGWINKDRLYTARISWKTHLIHVYIKVNVVQLRLSQKNKYWLILSYLNVFYQTTYLV